MYIQNEFFGNIQRIDCSVVNIEIKPYAQYPRAIHVRFLPNRKRKHRKTVIFGNTPFLIITEKENAIQPDSNYIEDENGNLISKYHSFDKQIENDFFQSLDKSQQKILFDARKDL
jgi:hypothetical protein